MAHCPHCETVDYLYGIREELDSARSYLESAVAPAASDVQTQVDSIATNASSGAGVGFADAGSTFCTNINARIEEARSSLNSAIGNLDNNEIPDAISKRDSWHRMLAQQEADRVARLERQREEGVSGGFLS